MGLFDTLGRAFDEGDAALASQRATALGQALTPGSAFNQSGQLTGDEGIISGAASLAANKVGVNTSAMDADTAAIGQLGQTYGNIAQNGGQLTQAVLDQARSDLANTGTHQLDAASRQQAGQVLAQDSAERNWAAHGKTQSRAQQLAAQLQKQLWTTAVSHANFQAALAAQGLKNDDRNAAFELANQVATAGQNAGNSGQTLGRAMQAQDFNNAMGIMQAVGSAAGSGASTIASMGGQGTPVASGLQTGYTAGAQTYDNGYAVPQAALGTSRLQAPTVSKYVNPVTGNTVNLNMPSDKNAWGDWLTSPSTLASV